MSYRIHICRIFFGRCARLVKKYVNRVDGKTYYFIRTANTSDTLGLNFTLQAPYSEVTVNYEFSRRGGVFHLDNARPYFLYPLAHGWPRLARVTLYANSTGSANVSLWVEAVYPDDPPNQTVIVAPDQTIELAYTADFDTEPKIEIYRTERDTELWGYISAIETGPPLEGGEPINGFAGLTVIFTSLVLGQIVWWKKRKIQLRRNK